MIRTAESTTTISRVTVVTPATHTAVCLSCGDCLSLGDLYCVPCDQAHALNEVLDTVLAEFSDRRAEPVDDGWDDVPF